MVTIGQKLAEIRRERGLSVEDVSHETRIHANTVLSIEADDLSRFPSVAYAKSFLRTYAEFLDVDVSHTLEALDEAGTLRLSENELLGEMKKTIKKDRRFRLERRPKAFRRRSDKPGGAPIFLNLILAVLIAAICVFYFLGYKASTPEEARSSIAKGLQKANPFAEESDESLVEGSSGGTGAPTPAVSVPVAEPIESSPIPVRPTLKSVDLSGAGPETPAEPAAVEGNVIALTPDFSVSPDASDELAIKKPEVSWEVDDARPAPLARVGNVSTAPAPRATPEIRIEGQTPDTPAYPNHDLPAVRRVLDEPNAALRPDGTTPPLRRGDERSGGGRQSGVSTETRAVPVATNE